MAGPEAHIFGIRHHGPGSAHALERALDALDPAEVLIEGPPEADGLLAHAASAAMRPPIALLVYAADEPAVASFYPLAEFSPEWRALRWALRRGRPVRFIDLPYGVGLAERLQPQSDAEALEADAQSPAPVEVDPLVGDPLSALAETDGWSDGESWWNAVVEQGAAAPEVFAAVERAMTTLRDETEADDRVRPDAEREARREAHMRIQIREALAAAQGPVAVVVGAWHVPALRRPVKAAEDRAVLKGLKPAKVSATWTPWTDAKLAAASGYGAGVISPGWYRLLWRELARREGFDARRLCADWCARAGEVLRREGLTVSTASLIETARLAESLAALRERPTPSLSELQDASLAALCGGEPAPLSLLQARLVIGSQVGEVDADVPQTPLQADLVRLQRRLRLKPEALPQELSLDLRSESGLERSTLLHRLSLIAVAWGRLQGAGSSRGTFRERWILEWRPELSVALVEALAWGTTVAGAAAGRASAEARDSQDLTRISELVQACLLADLPEAAEVAVDRMQALAVDTPDVGVLMEAVPPLVQVLRYGTARRMPEAELRRLVEVLAEQVCVGLHYAARQLDEAAAGRMNDRLRAFDRSLSMLEDTDLVGDWLAALARLEADGQGAPAVRGAATRRLHDRQARTADETASAFSRALSPAVPAPEAAAWLEGFLGGEGEVLLHDPLLTGLIDSFLKGLDGETFESLLPALRRALSGLDAHQRRRLLDLAGAPETAVRAARAPAPASEGVEAEFARALPLLKTILGLEP